MAPQDSQNCGRDFAKRKQTDAEFAANSLLRMVIIVIAINVLLSRVTRHPAGMHCPAGDDVFFLVTGSQWQLHHCSIVYTVKTGHKYLL